MPDPAHDIASIPGWRTGLLFLLFAVVSVSSRPLVKRGEGRRHSGVNGALRARAAWGTKSARAGAAAPAPAACVHAERTYPRRTRGMWARTLCACMHA